jgi:serine/threonine protein kinase
MDNFEILEVIGKGAFSIVYKAMDKQRLNIVAIKRSLNTVKSKNLLAREFVLAYRINCPNIISVYNYYEDYFNDYMIIEYANSGDLLNYVNKCESLNENIIRYIFKQICVGVEYLHKARIIHGDVKLENILLIEKGSELIVKLGDLGFASEFNDKKKIYKYGSPLYTAPEIIIGAKIIGPESDIWSLGVVLYGMLYKEFPIKTKDERLDYLGFAVIGPKFKKDYSAQVEDLVLKMLNVSVNSRITIYGILKSEWLSPSFKLDLSSIVGIPKRSNSGKIPSLLSSPLNTASPKESPLPKSQP